MICLTATNTEEKYLKIMSNPNYNMGNNQEKKYTLSTPDNSLLIIVGLLIIIGFMAIFSAGMAKSFAETSNSFYYLSKQLICFVLGCGALFIGSKIPYKKWADWAIPIAWTVVGLLIAVHLFGVTANGATRWLNIGPIQFQPSEAAKLSIVALLAKAFSTSAALSLTSFSFLFATLSIHKNPLHL